MNANMDVDMDMDIDIDVDVNVEVDPEIAALEAEANRIEAESSAAATAAAAAAAAVIEEPIRQEQHDSELPTTASQPRNESLLNSSTFPAADGGGNDTNGDAHITTPKVYIRGLDTLTTGDIKSYAAEHYSLDHYVKVEWIDDTSANIVYDNADAALEALRAFSAFSAGADAGGDLVISTLDLRPAKRLSKHPGVELLARQAVIADVKRPRAHEASRFYLLNPDKDPRERRRVKQDQRYRGRRDGRERDRRRGGHEEGEEGEEEGAAAAPFDVNMYDDDAGVTDMKESVDDGMEKRGSRSRRYSSDGRQRPGRLGDSGAQRNGDLFGRRDTGSRKTRGVLRRDRSISPDGHDSFDDSHESGYGRLGYEEIRVERFRNRSRRRSSPPVERLNAGKELFPASGPVAATTLLQSNSNSKGDLSNGEASALTASLSSSSPSSKKRPRELFPNRTNVSNHRRTAAFDAADETAEIYSPKKRSVFSENSFGSENSNTGRLSRDLSSRITRGSVPDGNETGNRLGIDVDAADDVEDRMEAETGVRSRGRGRGIKNSRMTGIPASSITTATSIQSGFSIRGISDTANAGFSIQGAADAGGPRKLSVKELFPSKFGVLSPSSNNEEKELFGQKIRGRGAQRQRAQDMYF